MKRYAKAVVTLTLSHYSRRGHVHHPEYVLGCVYCQSSDFAASVVDGAIRHENPDEWAELASDTAQTAVAALELALGERLGDRIATPDQVRAGGGGPR